MHRPLRLLAVAALASAGLFAAASAAHAVVDPAVALECLTTSATDLTSLVDPTAPGVPAEVPGVNCLSGP
ncbi:hypothetical protein ITP53_38925 [Nonomuraea sp. K274]|uniref:Secreted protein n=1 Tax=Nonomuraea cypriaca TaxID=1187855 RepID=A0A931F166_9ACTN|nr:hypothetical protein [Nonomuraea cypriaca]MBF8191569.1 hypothetical protein [Nonomuraea cypriaca]